MCNLNVLVMESLSDFDENYGYGTDNTKYVCTVCGYVYDPEMGDPSGDILPGTSFMDLPASWRCPDCAVRKDSFEKQRE